jgi:hypothetical protein
MNRSLSVVAFLACIGASFFQPASVGASDRTQPMQFTLRQQGPDSSCGDHCRLYIAASGAITADTPNRFLAFAKNRKLGGGLVVLDSDGGSVHGAIALGREIRRLGLDTTVGRLADLKGSPAGTAIARATFVPRADCESMCSFVLLAGVHRSVPADARVMVHQIWLGDRREDPIAANYSAEDLVLVQRDIGKLAMYTAEMGASMDVLDLALRIPPWEPMHVMSRDEIQRLRVATEMPDKSAVATVASSPAKPAAQPQASKLTNGLEVEDISDRTWAMVARSGAATLARRYPLTVQGDEIGGFDLLISCNGGKKGYDAIYIEHRYPTDEVELPKALQSVQLQAGGHQASLQVMSSELQGGDELVSIATGSIPAGLIDGFGAEGSHSMMVDTEAGRMSTSMRIGNTGVAQNLSHLAAACGMSSPAPQRQADATPAK